MTLDVTQFTDEHINSLAALVGEPLVVDEDIASARACLAVAWENVKEAGSPAWTLESAPPLAITILLNAASRAWMNLGGFVDERADAVTLSRNPEYAAGAELTPQERDKLERLVGRDRTKGTLRSMGITTVSTVDRRGDDRLPWHQRNIMVLGPTMNPASALPIPYLPGDEEKAQTAGDVHPFVLGHYGTGWPFNRRAQPWRW